MIYIYICIYIYTYISRMLAWSLKRWHLFFDYATSNIITNSLSECTAEMMAPAQCANLALQDLLQSCLESFDRSAWDNIAGQPVINSHKTKQNSGLHFFDCWSEFRLRLQIRDTRNKNKARLINGAAVLQATSVVTLVSDVISSTKT